MDMCYFMEYGSVRVQQYAKSRPEPDNYIRRNLDAFCFRSAIVRVKYIHMHIRMASVLRTLPIKS